MHKMFLKDDGTFIIENYNERYPFSNFLPALAGVWGIPLWAFYVNRGQGMVSFGVHDKNHSIGEFYPAERAYRVATTAGFRTFLMIDDTTYYEPFVVSDARSIKRQMHIRSHDVALYEANKARKLEFAVQYFTFPNARFAALVRSFSVKNTSCKTISVKMVDGLPRIIPFGARDLFLKHLSRTLEAWMYSETTNALATFKLLVDPKDTAQTKYVEGANFLCSFYEDNCLKRPRYIVDPWSIFGMDTSFVKPNKLIESNFKFPQAQVMRGRTPSAFSYVHWQLKPGQQKTMHSLLGGVFDTTVLEDVKKINSVTIGLKEKENKELIESIKDNALTLSGMNNFDQYIRHTYLDNILRGGLPYSQNRNRVYYVFSRKHGDLERDYNRFKIFASHFSEGEANYRDVNQNRRMDLFFNPFIEKSTIVYFLDLLKIDGYNPLVVKGEKLYFQDKDKIKMILAKFKIEPKESILNLFHEGFYLGELFILLENEGIAPSRRSEFVDFLLNTAERETLAQFGEGYWIDHWRYNLDLIESFLYFYPDKKKELFLDTEFLFWDDEYRVKKRISRYTIKNKKVHQAQSVEAVEEKRIVIEKRHKAKNFLRTHYGKGKLYSCNLFIKMLSLILNKTATLDPDGIGIEMEADKPGWCDSLNGLPALFGSCFCETLELERAVKLVIAAIDSVGLDEEIHVPEELYDFYQGMEGVLEAYRTKDASKREYWFWDAANRIKETFREVTFFGVSGRTQGLTLKALRDFLVLLLKRLSYATTKAKENKSKLYYSYFFYEATKYKILSGKHIIPLSFKRKNVPLFLEACVHHLRVKQDKNIIKHLKASSLFDKKLKMYRLNESLSDQPLEIGRSRIFPPGWLENESVWLHMEYKYILELLKNGFVDEFYKDFFNCCVCFFDPSVYGRSILENSSFIVSSVYPDVSLWGKGFVARLTGATVELLNMWIVMCLGLCPFFLDEKGKLCVQFNPLLKKEFFTTKKSSFFLKGKTVDIPENAFAFKLFSSILIVFHNPKRKDTWHLKTVKIKVKTPSRHYSVNSSHLKEPISSALRQKHVERIDVYLH